ncbi:hypothetical protein P7K49_013555 [Saguinus oedipus]|uniref:Uncharacterized protein n=1 Tax=Saguinus oedipus TaxID=9490 RepID=A0ABQ9VH20_SAGOE|nr:hypothetical protein P7K49_013555 [Saguinus oedipus]
MSLQVNLIAQSIVVYGDLEILTMAWDGSVSQSSKGTVDGLEKPLMVSRGKLPAIAGPCTRHCPVCSYRPHQSYQQFSSQLNPLNGYSGPGQTLHLKKMNFNHDDLSQPVILEMYSKNTVEK